MSNTYLNHSWNKTRPWKLFSTLLSLQPHMILSFYVFIINIYILIVYDFLLFLLVLFQALSELLTGSKKIRLMWSFLIKGNLQVHIFFVMKSFAALIFLEMYEINNLSIYFALHIFWLLIFRFFILSSTACTSEFLIFFSTNVNFFNQLMEFKNYSTKINNHELDNLP
jgi:hypothetical protein